MLPGTIGVAEHIATLVVTGTTTSNNGSWSKTGNGNGSGNSTQNTSYQAITGPVYCGTWAALRATSGYTGQQDQR